MVKDEVFEQYSFLYKKKLKEGILSLDDDLESFRPLGLYYPAFAYIDGVDPEVCLKMFEAQEGVLEDYDTLHKLAKHFFIDSDEYFNRTYDKNIHQINYEEREKVFNEIDEFVEKLKCSILSK